MLVKYNRLPGVGHDGEPLIHVVDPGERVKLASGLVPEVQSFIQCLRPDPRFTYVLVNAMGYSEYYGANSNTDWYGYNSKLDFNGLLHAPPDWGKDPANDQKRGKLWPYGYPTYYGATVYAHHQNKDREKYGFGDIIFVAPNHKMKRIELVKRIDNELIKMRGRASILDRIRHGERVDVSMGCLKAGALIAMADGTQKPIEDVEIGDRVLTHTGEAGKVTELHRRRYQGEFFEVRPANSPAFHATCEHPFWAARDAKDAYRVWRKEKPEFGWKYTKSLESAVLARPKITKVVDPGVSPELARLIGYYLADGCIARDKNGSPRAVVLTVSAENPIVETVEALCGAVGTQNAPRITAHPESRLALNIRITDPGLAETCLHLAGSLSKTKKLAEEVLYWPHDLQLELLGAYGNGDGFASKDGSFSFSTSSEDLAAQLREILFRLGIPTSHQVLTHKAGSGFSAEDTTEYVVFIGRQWVPRFRGFCAKVIIREVKKRKNIFKDYGDLWAVPIREYESYYDEAEVYNFEVEGDNSYIVNGVAAHNCKVPFDLCHTAGTLVRTPGGHRPIEDLQVGDTVISHVGEPRRVTRTFERVSEPEEILSFNTVGIPSLRASAAHPLFVVRREQVRSAKGRRHNDLAEREIVPEWVPAEDVRVGDYLLAQVPAGGSFREERAKLLGYYLGDGHIIRQRTGKRKDGPYRNMGVGFTVSVDEEEHKQGVLRELAELLSNEPRVYSAGSGRRAEIINCYDQSAAKWLIEMGGRGCRHKRLSEVVYSWDRTSRAQLFAGWIDTDGYVNEASIRGTSVNRGLALDMKRLANSLGLPASITVSYRDGSPVYTVGVGRGAARQALPELAQYSVKVGRVPSDRAGGSGIYRFGDYYAHVVRSVEVLEDPQAVYNLSVAEDESYLAEGVASHNCSICTDWNTIQKAWDTFDQKKHLHPGIAILRYHKTVAPIRGLSITKADYCEHMLKQKGKILPNGQKVFVYNDFPRFFDNSFVWIGADKTARVMWFLSADMPSKADILARQQMPRIVIKDRTIVVKTAMEKVAGAPVKLSEISKEIPGGIVREVRLRSFTEPDIDKGVLEHSSKVYGIRQLLSTLAALGIVLKPGEFQHIVTASKPMGDRINAELDKKACVFDTSLLKVADDFSVSGDLFDQGLGGIFSDMVPHRSSFAPHLGPRCIGPALGMPGKTASAVRTPYLDEIAAQYNGYRISIMEKAPELFPKYAAAYPLDPGALIKVSQGGLASLLLGLAPVVHLISSHLQEREASGKDLGTVGKFVADNPGFTRAMTIGVGLRAAMGVQSMGGLSGVATKLFNMVTGNQAGGSGLVQALGTVARAM